MALRNQPYLPLYVQDFMTDEKLNECSAASTGVYIRIMCLMHKSEEYGKITLKNKDLSLFNGKSPVERFASKFIKHMPYSIEVIRAALLELIEENVLYIEGNSLCQKRMIKDGYLSTVRAIAGRKGASKTNQKYFAETNSQQTETANNEQPNPEEEPKDNKKKYADTVRLTEKEFKTLVELVGEKGTARMIDILDSYKGSKGKRYKSDYKALRGWVLDKYKEEQQKYGTKETEFNNRDHAKGVQRNYDESF